MKHISKYKNLIIILLILFLFRDFFNPYYQKYIVEPFLAKFNQSIQTDFIFFVAIIFLICWTVKKIKIKFYLKNDYVVYSIVTIIIYTLIHINYDAQLLVTETFNQIKYSDIVYVLALIPIFIRIGFIFKTSESSFQIQDFFDDNPLKNPDEDFLNRKSKASQVKRLIVGNKSKNSLALGIVGDWGSGKTSFMNFVEKSFENEEDYIIVHFNSWLNISINSIIQDFFNTVQKEVSKYSIDVSKEIRVYGNKVLSISKNSTTETLLNAINILPENSMSANFNNLNELLNKLNKRVIVFFDDLDRLQPNEVFEVLKLIRNTASFDIFTYVVGYDKKYLNEALCKNDVPFPDKYCEKIFLKEFPLPPITQSQINDYIKEKILLFVPEKEDELENIFEYINTFIFYNDENIFKSIKNIRNAKRFLNEFKISIEKVKDEIYLQDFILIKLLKFSYYEAYSLLFSKDTYIENNKDGYSGNAKYTHYKLRKSDKKDDSFVSYGNSFENSLLKEDLISLDIFNDDELKTIGIICNRIFDNSNRAYNVNRNAITYGHNYYRYFEDEISASEITNTEFNSFLNATYEEKKQIVDKAYNDDRLIGMMLFLYKVDVYRDLKTKSEYEDFIKILFYIANLKSKTKYLHYNGIDFEFLDSCMNNFKNLLIDRFGYDNEECLKYFYKSLFYEKKAKYDFETDFVKYLYDRHGSNSTFNIPFNKEEIDDYLEYCFENDSKLIKGIDDNFWHCYRLCFVKDWQRESSNTWRPITKVNEANKEKLLFNIIPNYFDEFLVSLVYPQSFFGEDDFSNKVAISADSAIRIVGNLDDFITYLESDKLADIINGKSVFINEFINFAKEVNKTKDYINFKFTYPPALQKLENHKIRK